MFTRYSKISEPVHIRQRVDHVFVAARLSQNTYNLVPFYLEALLWNLDSIFSRLYNATRGLELVVKLTLGPEMCVSLTTV